MEVEVSVARVISGIDELARELPHAVVTVGSFDGVHRGHQALIGEAIRQARAAQGTAVVFTFNPHPQAVLRPETAPPLLLTYEERREALLAQGPDLVIEQPFSREFSSFPAERFFGEVLLRKLSARSIVVGYDFGFGRDRAGSLEQLRKLCAESGVNLTVLPALRVGDEVVSSSRIRAHLQKGQVAQAAAFIGQPFFYRGHVIRGEGRGRTIGFPTANLALKHKLTLPYGVYATEAEVDGKIYASVTNVGVRPTFAEGRELPALVETHLLGTTLDLYGKVLTVRFVEHLRSEKRFPSIDALKAQIAEDATRAAALLSAQSKN